LRVLIAVGPHECIESVGLMMSAGLSHLDIPHVGLLHPDLGLPHINFGHHHNRSSARLVDTVFKAQSHPIRRASGLSLGWSPGAVRWPLPPESGQ
jgi:hypothetical protein